MVVDGLLRYIVHCSHQRRVELSRLATLHREETGKSPKLLLSLSTAVNWIWFSPVPVLQEVGDYPKYTSVSGPDLHLVADRARCLVRALKSAGLVPVFFVHGQWNKQEDLSEGYQVQQILEGTTAKAFESVVDPNRLAVRQILQSLREEGAELEFAVSGLVTTAIARYVRAHNETCGVVSQQADYAVISGCVLFPLKGFDSGDVIGFRRGVTIREDPDEIIATAISSAGLAESLKIREEQLPDLAVLCGTEYTHLLLTRLSVLTALGVEGSDVENIADWLRKTDAPLLENEAVKRICRLHPEFREALEKSYKHFAVEDLAQFDPASCASPVYELVEREMTEQCPLALTAARRGRVFLPVVLESATLGQPSITELLRPLRFIVYSLLGLEHVWEVGRTVSKAYDRQKVSVCSGEKDIAASTERLDSLRGLAGYGKLRALYELTTTSTELSLDSVFEVVDAAIGSSLDLPELEWETLHKLTLLCCGLRLLALLNRSSSLSITDEEMGTVVVACLTCATEGKVLPHIVHILPSMKAVSIAEWFSTVLDMVYQLSGVIGLAESTPEPRNLFYSMAFIPYHLALEPRTDLTFREKTDIDSVKKALDLALSLPAVAKFRSSVFDGSGQPPLPELLTQCNAALNEIVANAEQLLPRTMTASLSELFGPEQEEDGESESEVWSESEERSKSEDESEQPVWGHDGLPITEHRDKILELISEFQVVCVEGETGCGKSSQVPQFIMERFPDSKILVSQPNVLAAKKLAERVGEELLMNASLVTYCDEMHTDDRSARLTYGTNQFLLKALLNAKEICPYTHLLLDEIHERTTDIDFGLFMARQLAARMPTLKIVLMSATLQGSLFVEYFRQGLGHARVCNPYFVGIRRFPIRVFFIDELSELVSEKEDAVQSEAMTRLLRLQTALQTNATILSTRAEVSKYSQEVCINLILSVPEPGQAVLIFLPGLSDIIDIHTALLKKLAKLNVKQRFRVFVLHHQVPVEEEEEAFGRPQSGQANIIFSTSIAESSFTFPYLKLVIDFAIRRYMIYNPSTRKSKLTRQWCSKASCTQRAGRVGRTSPGTVVHLITKDDHKKLPDFNLPDIISSPLSKTVLKAKQLIKRDCGATLPSQLLSSLIEPPSLLQFEAALAEVVDIGALHAPKPLSASEEEEATLLGKFCVDVPLDLQLCRLILLGILFGCPNDAVVLAAGLSMYQDIFTIPTRMIMNDMRQFCESLSRSTFSRLSLDNGCYSNPIMIRNMFLEWLRFADCHWTDNRRSLANQFSFKCSVRVQRLLHFEALVADIAQAVVQWLPTGTRAREELETLSRIDKERPISPVMCSTTYFTREAHSPLPPSPPSSAKYIPPHMRNLANQRLAQQARRPLHFCSDYVLLKTLITAASPGEIMLGERQCDSSHPNLRTFARSCIEMAKGEEFPPAHTLAMDLAILSSTVGANEEKEEKEEEEEEEEEVNEDTIHKLYTTCFPRGFRFQARVRVDKENEAAVINFIPAAEERVILLDIAREMGYNPASRLVNNDSTVELSFLSPKLQFLYRVSECRPTWEVEGIKATFPNPFHPSSIIWHMMNRERPRVNTTLLNSRNPTSFACLFKKPDYPYLAVASRSFTNDNNMTLAPDITFLPPPPHSLVMVLALQLSSSVTELLVDREKKQVEGLRLNHNEIPCKDIASHLSVERLVAINHFRRSLSRALSLSIHHDCFPEEMVERGDVQETLKGLFSASPPPTGPEHSQTASSVHEEASKTWASTSDSSENRSKLVWEMVTPGVLVGITYPPLRCTLLGTEPYQESAACTEVPAAARAASSAPVQYQDSVSTRLLLAEFRRVEGECESDDEDNSTAVALSETGWLLPKKKRDEPVKDASEGAQQSNTGDGEGNLDGSGASGSTKEKAGKDEEPGGKENSEKGSASAGEVVVSNPSKEQAKKTPLPPAVNILFPALVAAKLQQEVVRHLQRNNKMEFLSELRVQRRIKHICSLIKTTLNVAFFLQQPELFQVREVEEEGEGPDAATEGREYLVVLDRSQWRDVDSDEEEPVLPPSMRIISRARRIVQSQPPAPSVVTEGTQTEEGEAPKSSPEPVEKKPVAEPPVSSPSKPLTAVKLSDSRSSMPNTTFVTEEKKTEKKEEEKGGKMEAAKVPSSAKVTTSSEAAEQAAKPPPSKTEPAKKAAMAVTKKKALQPGTRDHLAQYLRDCIREGGGEVRLTALTKKAFPEYFSRYYSRGLGFNYLRKDFLQEYPQYFKLYKNKSENINYVKLVESEEKQVTTSSECKAGSSNCSSNNNSPPLQHDKKSAKVVTVRELPKKPAEAHPKPSKGKPGSETDKGTAAAKPVSPVSEVDSAVKDEAQDGGQAESQTRVSSVSAQSQVPMTAAGNLDPILPSTEPTHSLSQVRSKATPTRDLQPCPTAGATHPQPSPGKLVGIEKVQLPAGGGNFPPQTAAVSYTTGVPLPSTQLSPAMLPLAASTQPQFPFVVVPQPPPGNGGGASVVAPPTLKPHPPQQPSSQDLQQPPKLEAEEMEGEGEEWHSSGESWLSEEESEQQSGSADHVAHYLLDYLHSQSHPFGCTIAELNEHYQTNYKKEFGSKKLARISRDFIRAYPHLFKVSEKLFLRLREGVVPREANMFRGQPYTPEHVNDYFTRYLGGVQHGCSMVEAQDVFENVYKKKYAMPQSPRIWFLRDNFFSDKRSAQKFEMTNDLIVFSRREPAALSSVEQ